MSKPSKATVILGGVMTIFSMFEERFAIFIEENSVWYAHTVGK
ncbi:hypothetical protein PS673_02050 [Pseudomonas fluorescens]|uniref:Uncharacterized protein n=1 Tax=Pseudomonas fluorescens TaxID=294 RepID=A0A5E6S6Z1_PSEFL|nr:hypothetical protein PS673_02050 [Pseudomonas fluorescens]